MLSHYLGPWHVVLGRRPCCCLDGRQLQKDWWDRGLHFPALCCRNAADPKFTFSHTPPPPHSLTFYLFYIQSKVEKVKRGVELHFRVKPQWGQQRGDILQNKRTNWQWRGAMCETPITDGFCWAKLHADLPPPASSPASANKTQPDLRFLGSQAKTSGIQEECRTLTTHFVLQHINHEG